MTSPGSPEPGATDQSSSNPVTSPPTGPDWTDQVADLVVDSVDKVRAKTTGPVLNVSHAAVYAVVAAIVVIPVVAALLAALIKFLNWIIPGDIWIVYMIVAVLMWLTGWLLWTLRSPRTRS